MKLVYVAKRIGPSYMEVYWTDRFFPVACRFERGFIEGLYTKEGTMLCEMAGFFDKRVRVAYCDWY